jgi:hypothetical protein
MEINFKDRRRVDIEYWEGALTEVCPWLRMGADRMTTKNTQMRQERLYNVDNLV